MGKRCVCPVINDTFIIPFVHFHCRSYPHPGDFDADSFESYQTPGKVLLFAYLLVGAVVLFNLLIAVITDVYAVNTTSKKAFLEYTKYKGGSIIRFLQLSSSQGLNLPH